MKQILALKHANKALLLSLLLAFMFSLYGIHWGRVEDWNPDSRAFHPLFRTGLAPFNPGWFRKPPFHTYFTWFLCTGPLELAERVAREYRHTKPIRKPLRWFLKKKNYIQLVWARLLVVTLFLGSVWLVFAMTSTFSGGFAAGAITLLFATGAGFILHNHFLTVDIPVLFWMLLALFFAHRILRRGNWSSYLLAGLLTGVSTATKYNALAVGIAIPVAHLFSLERLKLRETLFSKKLWVALVLVPAGFVLANPFAVLDYQTFVNDFIYNYKVTPIYHGQTDGHSYWRFFGRFSELIGLPATLLLGIAVVTSAVLILRLPWNLEKKNWLLMLAVVALYYAKFGGFPRMEVRFVLPIVPVWMMLGAPAVARLERQPTLVCVLVGLLVSYNGICNYYIGRQFVNDPRMLAQRWIIANAPRGASVESSSYSPTWEELPDVRVQETRMPHLSERAEMFSRMFADDPWIMRNIEKVEGTLDDMNWYSPQQFLERQPDFVAINWLGQTAYNAPLFSMLRDGELPYELVFDNASPDQPRWVYPRNLTFVQNHQTIFTRSTDPASIDDR